MPREMTQFRLSTTERQELTDLADALGGTTRADALRFAVSYAMQNIALLRGSLASKARSITTTDMEKPLCAANA
jgi:hypothetical protein